MLKLIEECSPWLKWQTGLVAALAIVGIVACTGLPSWSLLAGATSALHIL